MSLENYVSLRASLGNSLLGDTSQFVERDFGKIMEDAVASQGIVGFCTVKCFKDSGLGDVRGPVTTDWTLKNPLYSLPLATEDERSSIKRSNHASGRLEASISKDRVLRTSLESFTYFMSEMSLPLFVLLRRKYFRVFIITSSPFRTQRNFGNGINEILERNLNWRSLQVQHISHSHHSPPRQPLWQVTHG